MTKEAKIGLLLGLLFIVAIAVVLRGVHEDTQPALEESLALQDAQQKRTAKQSEPENPVKVALPEQRPRQRVVLEEETLVATRDEKGPGVEVDSAREEGAALSSVRVMEAGEVRHVQELPKRMQVEDAEGRSTEVVVRPGTRRLEDALRQVTVPVVAQRTVQTGSRVLGGERTYVVEKGDHLTKIAQKMYGEAAGNRRVVVSKLYEANKDRLSSKDMLRVGQSLRIPVLRVEGQTVEPKGTVVRPATGAGQVSAQQMRRTYTVEKGDSLWKIAEKQLGDGSKYKALLEVNKDVIDEQHHLRPGMTLRLP